MLYTVVCSVRNEGPFLVEWVAWQRMLGFSRIVVVTNDCTDHSPELLDALQAAGWIVHLRRNVPGLRNVCGTKLAAAKRLRPVRRADWVMVCDVDEFLVVHTGGGRIADLIAAVDEPFLGMAINWRVFGTSGRKAWEDGLIHRQFSRAAPRRHAANRWIKCVHGHADWFARLGEHGPRRLDLRAAGADWGAPGMRWVNSAGETLDQWQPDAPYLRRLHPGQVTHAAAQINHYILRSEESFGLKRGTKSAVAGVDRYTDDFFHKHNLNDEVDRAAIDLAPRFDPIHAQAMALPGVARLHHLCCADYAARLCEKAGRATSDDPRHAWHLRLAEAARQTFS
ncbi:MAG: glycosyltransferase family 2 protein [Paracoccaceae bacterium]